MTENRGKEQRHQLNCEIGKRCRDARISAKLTQEKLAEMLGCNSQFISDAERGIVGFSLLTLKELSEILGVTTDYLIKGTKSFEDTNILTLGNRAIQLTDKESAIMAQGIETLLSAFNLHEKNS